MVRAAAAGRWFHRTGRFGLHPKCELVAGNARFEFGLIGMRGGIAPVDLVEEIQFGALLIFGGATLQDFAFALMVGILSGAYSSIFIAAPLLTIWKEREPEYARRKGQEPEQGPDEDGHPARRRPILPRGGSRGVCRPTR